jgi:hypothetical protein
VRTPEPIMEKRSRRRFIDVANLGGNRVKTQAAVLDQVARVLDPQILEVCEGDLPSTAWQRRWRERAETSDLMDCRTTDSRRFQHQGNPGQWLTPHPTLYVIAV